MEIRNMTPILSRGFLRIVIAMRWQLTFLVCVVPLAPCWPTSSFLLDDHAQGQCPSVELVQRKAYSRHNKGKANLYYDQVLKNTMDTSYTGEIFVGGQKLQAVLDTGSYELLVFSKDCKTCGAAGEQGYDKSRSSTFVEGRLAQLLTFGSGSTFCQDAIENLRIGPLQVNQQPIWEVLEADMDILESSDFQAILGLGPVGTVKLQAEMDERRVAALKKQLEVWGAKMPKRILREVRSQEMADRELANLYDSVPGNLKVRFLSVCLGQAHGSQGHLIWNDQDPTSRHESFTRLQVIGQVAWSLTLQNVRLVSRDGIARSIACSKGCAAILDSGTSLISAPDSAIDEMSNYLVGIGASCYHLQDLPSLEFELGGVKHTLPAETYMGFVLGYVKASWKSAFRQPEFTKVLDCEMLLMSTGDTRSDQGPVWIIGMPFFRHYYVTFDYGEHPSAANDKRSIWTAPVDHKCRPKNPPPSRGIGLLSEDASTHSDASIFGARRLDASKLHLPRWMANRTSSRFAL
eukprot:TRINITY_DN28495_c0_g1_i1.p1 TRINITY_DN28495_c0_g1~~TRINITY_DN28495_c0_g1_i1.p1  ORF type:complete len:518 (-),score=56.70 TRINITY_DN28495_c0_g1_i1:158-1711(-)